MRIVFEWSATNKSGDSLVFFVEGGRMIMRISMALMTGCVTGLAASLVSAVPAPVVAEADSTSSERYRIIVERQPFGDLSPPPQPTTRIRPAPPPPPQAAPFVDGLRMCAIHQGADGVLRVGLATIAPAPTRRVPIRRGRGPVRAPVPPQAAQQKNYYLRVGQTSDDGITLLDANYEEKKALLSQNDERHWIFMDGQSQPAEEIAMTQPVAAPLPRPPAPAASSVATPAEKHPQTMSREERMRWRRQEILRRRQESANTQAEGTAPLTPEERRKKLQDLNMALIRARGEKGPPLPIALTPEQDRQLVSEGVLPPQE
jgi:hypothetical protein